MQLIFIVMMLFFTEAHITCEYCRPLDIQNSPGIGFELNTRYGTAAMRYPNGTVIDVAEVAGTEAYIAAMGPILNNIAEFSLPPDYPIYPQPPTKTLSLWQTLSRLGSIIYERIAYKILQLWQDNFDRPIPKLLLLIEPKRLLPSTALQHVPRSVLPPDLSQIHDTRTIEWIKAASEMISALKHAVEDVQSLTNPAVYAAIPDYFHNENYLPYFHTAFLYSGLHMFSPIPVSTTIINEIPKLCASPFTTPCPPAENRNVTSVLSIEYTTGHMSLTLLKRSDTDLDENYQFMIASTSTNIKLGANNIPESASNQDQASYWESVRQFIESQENPQYIVLRGDSVSTPQFSELLQEIYEKRSSNEELFDRTAQLNIFGAARSMARRGRQRMMHGFSGCHINSRCPIGERDDDMPEEWAHIYDRSQKDEL